MVVILVGLRRLRPETPTLKKHALRLLPLGFYCLTYIGSDLLEVADPSMSETGDILG